MLMKLLALVSIRVVAGLSLAKPYSRVGYGASCISLTNHDDSYLTAPITLGSAGDENLDVVVDTGSEYLVIESGGATASTQYTGKSLSITYGSGTITTQEATDEVTIGSNTNTETLYIIDSASSATFAGIEGILPLRNVGSSILHTSGFSICYSSSGGSLKSVAGTTSVSATSEWEVSLSGISVNSVSAGVTGKAIPDSGTTLLIGPLNDLYLLFEKLCSEWSKCSGSSAEDFVAAVESNCATDMPNITLSFSSDSATIQGSSLVYEYGGACNVAFDYSEYYGLSMWILGLPLFYGNEVSFDTDNSKVGFDSSGCSGCSSSLATRQSAGQSPDGRPRQLKAPPRPPSSSRGRQRLQEAAKPVDKKLLEFAKFLDAKRL